MFLLQSIRIALQALRVNKLRSSLTMLGIVIGVGAVIAMVAVGSGASQRIQEQMASIGSNLLMVQPGSRTSGGMHMGHVMGDVAALLAFLALSRGEGRAPSRGGDTPQVLSVVALPPTRGVAWRVVEAARDAGADFILVRRDVAHLRNLFGRLARSGEQGNKRSQEKRESGATSQARLRGRSSRAIPSLIQLRIRAW